MSSHFLADELRAGVIGQLIWFAAQSLIYPLRLQSLNRMPLLIRYLTHIHTHTYINTLSDHVSDKVSFIGLKQKSDWLTAWPARTCMHTQTQRRSRVYLKHLTEAVLCSIGWKRRRETECCPFNQTGSQQQSSATWGQIMLVMCQSQVTESFITAESGAEIGVWVRRSVQGFWDVVILGEQKFAPLTNCTLTALTFERKEILI